MQVDYSPCTPYYKYLVFSPYAYPSKLQAKSRSRLIVERMARDLWCFRGLCCLLVLVIMCHELVVHAEGRHLTRDTFLEGKSSGGESKGASGSIKVEQLEDFEPTDPGHSPGVGHTIGNWIIALYSPFSYISYAKRVPCILLGRVIDNDVAGLFLYLLSWSRSRSRYVIISSIVYYVSKKACRLSSYSSSSIPASRQLLFHRSEPLVSKNLTGPD